MGKVVVLAVAVVLETNAPSVHPLETTGWIPAYDDLRIIAPLLKSSWEERP